MASARVSIIGAGLAGSEAALVLALHGARVDLFEMRPGRMTPAHRSGLPAELVCSNSFKSQLLPSAHALLKEELRILGSPLLEAARDTAIPAGSALAVDRSAFSQRIAQRLDAVEGIRLIREECHEPPSDSAFCIIAAGPLVSNALVRWFGDTFSSNALSFYDAIAPIVSFDTIDTRIAFFANRRDPSAADYLNCPFAEHEYRRFCDALLEADAVDARAFEQERFFEACLPVEVVARRGADALLFGTLRPIGLKDPRTGRRPYAVCQLRRENAAGEAYGMVGFQTRLRKAAQRRVFRLIPGLANAEFLRYGSIHRNSYIDSPSLLDSDLSFKDMPQVWMAGQLAGNEGYTESIATGHLAARAVLARLKGRRFFSPAPSTACGALLRHVTASQVRPFTPSNINFGLIDMRDAGRGERMGKSQRRERCCERALGTLQDWKQTMLP